MDGPGTVRVTLVYRNTLTGGGGIAVAIHGWSEDYQSNFGVRGYSDIGGEAYSSGYPWGVAVHGQSGVCQSNFGVWGYSDIGGYISGYPWMVRGLSE